jgi:hypothetical protein
MDLDMRRRWSWMSGEGGVRDEQMEFRYKNKMELDIRKRGEQRERERKD